MKHVYAYRSALLIFSGLYLASCGTRIQYVGSSSKATQNVEVFVDASSITRPYNIIGKGYPSTSVGIPNVEKVQAKAILKAKQIGADAILFQDYFLTHDGLSVNSYSKTDSVGKGLVTVSNTTATPVISTRLDILFLKYR